MKTRILMSVLAIGLSIALIGGATMAWFTDDAEVPAATFTAGTVEVAVGEDDPVIISIEGYVQDNVNPGDEFEAGWTFKNKGTKNAQFRVILNNGWSIDAENYAVSDERLARLLVQYEMLEDVSAFDATNKVTYIEQLEDMLDYDPLNSVLVDGSVYECEVEGDTYHWFAEKDGDSWVLYYCDENGDPVDHIAPEAEVKLYFDVVFDANDEEGLDNKYMGAKYVLGSEGSKVEAIQASHDAPAQNGWVGPFEDEE